MIWTELCLQIEHLRLKFSIARLKRRQIFFGRRVRDLRSRLAVFEADQVERLAVFRAREIQRAVHTEPECGCEHGDYGCVFDPHDGTGYGY